MSRQRLDFVPSASGVVKFYENFYVAGDDSPYLFCIDTNFNLTSKTLIYPSHKMQGETIPKAHKPDFEAMEMVSDKEVLIVGSGSLSPQRDICILVTLGKTISYKTYNITGFYDYLRQLDHLKNHELNIEGLAYDGHLLYFFNRGQNLIISVPYQAFLTYCKTGTPIPVPNVKSYTLPAIGGLEAGFSGATFCKENKLLIFTASVEDTPNAYDDGDILGSFLGLIKLKNNEISDTFIIKKIPNQTFPLKIEGITIDKSLSTTQTKLVLVTDNDGEPSEIIRLQLNLV